MVSVGYMIDNPGPPGRLRTFVNQRVMPPAIDAAGTVESAVYALCDEVRARARRRACWQPRPWVSRPAR